MEFPESQSAHHPSASWKRRWWARPTGQMSLLPLVHLCNCRYHFLFWMAISSSSAWQIASHFSSDSLLLWRPTELIFPSIQYTYLLTQFLHGFIVTCLWNLMFLLDHELLEHKDCICCLCVQETRRLSKHSLVYSDLTYPRSGTLRKDGIRTHLGQW